MLTECFYCRGTGEVPCDCIFENAAFIPRLDCSICGGEGKHTCPECNGSGMIDDGEDEYDEDEYDDGEDEYDEDEYDDDEDEYDEDEYDDGENGYDEWQV